MGIMTSGEPKTYFQARKKALDEFLSKERSSSLMKLYDAPKKPSQIVFETKGKCTALPFSQAFSTYGALLSKTFSLLVKEEKDPHSLFTYAAHEDGFFIYVAPSSIIEEATFLHILNTVTTVERIHIVVGKNAEIHIADLYETKNSSYIAQTTFEVEEGGKIFFHSLSKNCDYHAASFRALLKKNASCEVTFLHEAAYSKISFKVNLLEEGSSFSYIDFSKVLPECVSERFTSVDHDAPNTVSKKYVKKIVSGEGSSFYKGSISMKKEAFSSKAYQMHKAISLEKNALIYCSPLFDIRQKNVQATHGSTISSFDDDFLFYIRSRGMNEAQAKELFLKAFCGDIIHSFPPSQGVYFL